MKKKAIHIEHGSLDIEMIQSKGMAKYTLYDGYFSTKAVAQWYMPLAKDWRGEADAIAYRLKHDFNITCAHYSTCRRNRSA